VKQSRLVGAPRGPEVSNIGPDAVIVALADAQHGIVGRAQLLEAGVGPRAIKHRIAARRVHPLYRGVYAVGHRNLTLRGRWMAAVLATDGVLSHRSAGGLWCIRPWTGATEVTTRWARRPQPGLLLHRAVLAPDEITTHHGIPTTTPARTLLDLAAVLDRTALQRAINEAEIQRLPGPQLLMDRYPSKPGTANLRALAPPSHTKRELEARFVLFLNDRHFPRPQSNVLIEGQEVDAVWPDRRLIIELDGYETHGTRQAFENDRRKDRKLTAAGWTVIRITWRDLDDPEALAAELRALGL
jgi:very-short-patch-repair endonuclease